MDFRLQPEQEQIRDTVRRMAREQFGPKAYTWEEGHQYPWENARVLAEQGLTGITINPEDGGQGGSLLDAVLVLEAVAGACPHTGDVVQATNFGAIKVLAEFARPEVKRRVLPELLGGRAIITAAMSEPEAGSGLTDLRTTARIEGDEVVLNGGKIFNSNGPHASYYLVWARFGPRTSDIGTVLVEADRPGFSRGKPETFMSGELHCALYFDNCRVPMENLIIERDGFRKQMEIFNIERLGNTTRSLALAQEAYDRAVEHALERRQFNRPLAEFQGIQWKVAEMRMKLDAARLLLYRAVAELDGNGHPLPVNTVIAKAYTNQIAFEVASEALQIFGGYGYSTEYPLEYILRRVRGWMIAGGSIEMMKNRIAEEVFQRRFSQRPPKGS